MSEALPSSASSQPLSLSPSGGPRRTVGRSAHGVVPRRRARTISWGQSAAASPTTPRLSCAPACSPAPQLLGRSPGPLPHGLLLIFHPVGPDVADGRGAHGVLPRSRQRQGRRGHLGTALPSAPWPGRALPPTFEEFHCCLPLLLLLFFCWPSSF